MRAFLVLLLALAPLACQAQPGVDSVKLKRIEGIVSDVMVGAKIPGLSVAVAVDGKLAWSEGYGLSDVENNVPVKTSTVFRLASISKPITAVAALQLAERGKLDLDARVRKYVPSFPAKKWPITPSQLLGHLGGIRHYNNQAEVDSTRHYSDVTKPLDIFKHDPLVAAPGTKFHYTTYGYGLLGAVIVSASGSGFMEYLEENVFEPAGMDTIRDDSVHAIIPNRSRGYQLAEDGTLLNCNLADTSNKIPGGGMVSNSADLVKFALAVRNGKLLEPESVDRMFTAQTLADGTKTKYGLGWNIQIAEGERVVTHSGGQQGTSTMLIMLPKMGIVAVVMANLERAPVERLAVGIVRTLRE